MIARITVDPDKNRLEEIASMFTFTGVPSFSRPGCMPALWCPRHQELVDALVSSMQYFHFRHSGSTMFLPSSTPRCNTY